MTFTSISTSESSEIFSIIWGIRLAVKNKVIDKGHLFSICMNSGGHKKKTKCFFMSQVENISVTV